MKRIVLMSLILLGFVTFPALAQEESAHRLTVELLFPKKGGQVMNAPKPTERPKEASGLILIDLKPAPSKIEKERYSVEYFLDEELLYKSESSFTHFLDTTKYANGPHKVIVNFWDNAGPSAIGIREIIINNPNE